MTTLTDQLKLGITTRQQLMVFIYGNIQTERRVKNKNNVIQQNDSAFIIIDLLYPIIDSYQFSYCNHTRPGAFSLFYVLSKIIIPLHYSSTQLNNHVS